MSLCTSRTLLNEGPAGGTIATLRCKRWSCPDCAKLNRRRVIDRARDGNPTTFMTLTWNAKRPETPDQAARAMKHAWVLLRRRIHRKFGVKNIPFIVVFEKTKGGYPHMHMLLRAPFIPQDWLSDQMADLIDAPVCDIRSLKSRKMALFYVTKYLGKDLAPFEGCKRWWRSHNYEVETEERPSPFLYGGGFQVVDVAFPVQLARLLAGGYDIKERGEGWARYERRIWGGFDPTYGGRLAYASPVRRPKGRREGWFCD